MTNLIHAIARSTSHNEIVTIRHSAGDHERMIRVCDGWTDAGETEAGLRITEYWGTREDGTWRIHTIGR